MKNKPEKRGMTLVEMLMAIVILLVLIALTVAVGRRIENQVNEKLTRETIHLIDAALGEFMDFDYKYKDVYYSGLKFPIDCNDLDISEIKSNIRAALGGISVDIIDISTHEQDYSGCEVMYFWLNMVPASRAVLDEIDKSLIEKDGTIRINNSDNEEQPLLRIVDAWGTTLNYSYYYNGFENEHPEEKLREPDYYNDGEKRTFPLITSAGRDGEFGTEDDITNR